VARQRDTAIRLALGATRGALLREVLAETMAVAMVAAAIGFVLAKLAVALLVRVGPPSIPRLQQVSVSLGTYAFAAAMAIVVAIVCALFASIRTGGAESLRDIRPIGPICPILNLSPCAEPPDRRGSLPE
jgi:putative ABC transport system permease protein